MEKVQGWLKAHWKPFAIAFVAGIAVWFLFMRKNKGGATMLTIPQVSGGGSAAGAGGPNGSVANTRPVGTPMPAPAAAGPPSFMEWLQKNWNASLLAQGHGSLNQWINDLVSTYSQQTGQAASEIPQTGGLLTAPTVPGYDWFKSQYAMGGWRPPASGDTVRVAGPQRGSGFRGGDVYPPYAGVLARPFDARAATASRLPAAPLGTPVPAKQPTSKDVRNAPRRQTSIAQIARGNPPPTMPQSFSVPIREHLERTRPVLSLQAVSKDNLDAANPPTPHSPAPTQAELASSDQKATKPPPFALATPNIARGRARYGTQRAPTKPTRRWK